VQQTHQGTESATTLGSPENPLLIGRIGLVFRWRLLKSKQWWTGGLESDANGCVISDLYGEEKQTARISKRRIDFCCCAVRTSFIAKAGRRIKINALRAEQVPVNVRHFSRGKEYQKNKKQPKVTSRPSNKQQQHPRRRHSPALVGHNAKEGFTRAEEEEESRWG
jgi:hypothetical protein